MPCAQQSVLGHEDSLQPARERHGSHTDVLRSAPTGGTLTLDLSKLGTPQMVCFLWFSCKATNLVGCLQTKEPRPHGLAPLCLRLW